MDIYFDKMFLDSLPERIYDTIDQKLQRIYQYDFLQFRYSALCRKIKAVKNIFKFRFSDGDRIIFKYIYNGIRLIRYATHDKQIKVALNYNKIRDTLTDELIKWRSNAIKLLLLRDSPEETDIPDRVASNVKESSNNVYHNYQDTSVDTLQNQEDNAINISYEEDEIDEDIDASIIQLVKQKILDDDFTEGIVDKFLDNNDIEKAIYYEEIINIADRKNFYEKYRNSLSSITISKNEHGKVLTNDIREAINMFYDKTELCIYPLFYARVLGTGYNTMLYIQTENRKNISSNKNKIISLLINKIGAVEKWGEIVLSFLAIKKNNYASAVNDCGLVVESKCDYIISPSKKMINYADNNPHMDYNNPGISLNNINTFSFGKRYEFDDAKVLSHNLDFIFGEK